MRGKGGNPTGIRRCMPVSLKSIKLPSVAFMNFDFISRIGQEQHFSGLK